MDKNIYELLNGAEMDLTEYEVQDLSSEEKEMHMQHIMEKIKNDDTSIKNHTTNKTGRSRKIAKIMKVAAGFAAVVTLTFGVIGFVNPSLAQSIYNAIFSSLIESAQDDIFVYDEEIYAKIGKFAVPIKEELKKRPNDKDYVTSAECNGVTVSVSDVYCDGYILYYTLELDVNNPLLEGAEELFPYSINTNAMAWSEVEEIDMFEYGMGASVSSFKKTKNGKYVLMNKVFFLKGFPVDDDSIVAAFHMTGVNACSFGTLDITEASDTSANVEGEWNLRFPVTIDKSCNEIIEVNKKDKGITLRNLIKTRVAVLADVAVDLSVDDYFDPYEEMVTVSILNEANEYLPNINSDTEYDGGDYIYREMCVYDDQKELNVSIVIPGTGDNPEPEIPITEFNVKLP